MEQSDLCSQSGVIKTKLAMKRKNKFLSYSKKEKRAHISKSTTLDNFIVTSPTKSEENSSSFSSNVIITDVRKDNIGIEKEIKSEYFVTGSVTNECSKSVDFNSCVVANVSGLCSDNVDSKKTRNMLLEANNVKDDSSLNDSTEYFKQKSKSGNTGCELLCANQWTSEMAEPSSSNVDNKNMCRTQSDCTNTVMQTKRIQCPLCLKTIEKYVAHIKSCAAKKNLTTQQLMMALQLQKKQAEERLALGLPLLPEKLPVRRAGNNRGCPDANLDLALALSVSMKEAEETQILEEADILSQAGLKSEAAQKRSTLEGFGFASTRPRMGVTGRRARPLIMSTLMTRTQEDRERIISEKVSLVLISDDASAANVTEEFVDSEPIILSKKLSKQLNRELRLWKKSSTDEERSRYYVRELCEFVTPSKAEIGCNLRHLSQIAGRLNTPKTDYGDDIFDLPTPSHSQLKSAEQQRQSVGRTKSQTKSVKHSSTSAASNITARKLSSYVSPESNLLSDWRAVLGKDIMSDVTVLVRNSVKIPAHKLVIFVRCKEMLNDIKKNDDSGREIIVWNSCSKTSCLAFLEYLYCSTVNNLSCLSESELTELKMLATKYAVSELQKLLEETNTRVGSSPLVSSVRRKLFGDKRFSEKQNSGTPSDNKTVTTRTVLARNRSPTDSILEQTTVVCSPAGSSHHSSSKNKFSRNHVHESLDLLLSLLQEENLDSSSPSRVKSPNDVSPLGTSLRYAQGESESVSKNNKRKNVSGCGDNNHSDDGNDNSVGDDDYIVDSNDDDDDKLRSNKKQCYENAKYDLTQKLNDENIYDDLTQHPDDKNCEYDLTHKSDDENIYDDLTQSPDGKNCEYDLTQKLNDENIYDDLTQNLYNKNCEYDLTQKLNEENNDSDLAQELNKSDDDIMILSSDTETGENRVSERSIGDVEKNQLHGSRECMSSKLETPNCVAMNDLKELSIDNKSESAANLNATDTKSVSVIYEVDERDCIDPVWDGFEDLNCNINDVWQNDSPVTHQTSDGTATEKTISVTSVSVKDVHSNSSDIEIISPKTKTPIKTLLEDMETRSPKFNLFGKKFESVKSLTFESFFKSKRLRQETVVGNDDIANKSLKSNIEGILPNKTTNLLSVANIEHLSSEFETLNTSRNSSKDTQILESVLKHDRNCKAISQNSVMSPNNSRGCNYSDGKVCSQKSVPCVNTSHFDHDKSHKQRITPEIYEIHEVSESSVSDCDVNKKHNSTTILNTSQQASKGSDAHQVPESASQRSSINCMKALLDDLFEVNDTVLLKAEEQTKISKGAQKSPKKLTQSTPDRMRKRSKPVTSPNLERKHSKLTPSVNAAVTTTPSPQIIVSDKVTPMPNYSSMDTPLLKKELQKFGLKQSLGRNKAVLLLRYIYDQTHPVVPVGVSQQNSETVQTVRKANKSLFKSPNSKSGSPLKSKQEETALSESDNESDMSSYSTESVSSGSNTTEDKVDCAEDYDDENTQSTTDNSQATAPSKKLIKISCEKVDEVMRQMIINDSEFYSRLLTYEPVPLLEFINRVKAVGYRAKGSDVRRYLNSECIVYKLPKSNKQMQSRKRRRRRRSRCGSDSNRTSSNKSSPVKVKRVKSNENQNTVSDCDQLVHSDL